MSGSFNIPLGQSVSQGIINLNQKIQDPTSEYVWEEQEEGPKFFLMPFSGIGQVNLKKKAQNQDFLSNSEGFEGQSDDYNLQNITEEITRSNSNINKSSNNSSKKEDLQQLKSQTFQSDQNQIQIFQNQNQLKILSQQQKKLNQIKSLKEFSLKNQSLLDNITLDHKKKSKLQYQQSRSIKNNPNKNSNSNNAYYQSIDFQFDKGKQNQIQKTREVLELNKYNDNLDMGEKKEDQNQDYKKMSYKTSKKRSSKNVSDYISIDKDFQTELIKLKNEKQMQNKMEESYTQDIERNKKKIKTILKDSNTSLQTKNQYIKGKPYEIVFRSRQFLQIALIYMLFYGFLGPLIIFYFKYRYNTLTMARNLYLWGNKKETYIHLLFWFIHLLIMDFAFVKESQNIIDIQQIYRALLIELIVLTALMNIKYGYIHPTKFYKIQHEILSEDDKEELFIFLGWLNQKNKFIRQELQNSMARTQTQKELLTLQFAVPLQSQQKYYKLLVNFDKIDDKEEEEQEREFENLKNSNNNIVQNHIGNVKQQFKNSDQIHNQKIEILRQKYLKDNNIKDQIYEWVLGNKCIEFPIIISPLGINLIYELLKYYRDQGCSKNLERNGLILAFIKSMVCTGYLIGQLSKININHISEIRSEIVFIVIQQIIVFVSSFLLIKFVMLYFADIRRVTFLMNQMSHLISPIRQENQENQKKMYPTLSLLCSTSIKTWEQMRKIILDYGRQYSCRLEITLQVFIGIYVIYLLYNLAIVINLIPKELQVRFGKYLHIIAVSDLIILVKFIFKSIYMGGQINISFDTHQALLHKNKVIVTEILENKTLYSQNINKLQNPLYRQLVQGINEFESLCHLDSNEVCTLQKQTIQSINLLLLEMELQKKHSPYKVLNIAMTSQLAFQVGAAFMSLIGSILLDVYFN